MVDLILSDCVICGMYFKVSFVFLIYEFGFIIKIVFKNFVNV